MLPQSWGRVMGLAEFITNGLWRDLALVGAVVLNVIEGGRRKGAAALPLKVDLSTILQSLPQAALVFDAQARLVDCNQAAERLAQRSRNQLVCPGSPLLFPTGRGNPESLLDPLIRRMFAGETLQRERQTLPRIDGGPFEVLVSGAALRDSSGRVAGALLVMEESDEQSNLPPVAPDNGRSAISQTTAGLVHDFNNILNTISQASTLLGANQQRSDQDITLLNIIDQAVRHGSETVSNFRKYLVGNRETRSFINFALLLEEILQSAQPVLEERSRIRVRRQISDCGEVYANRDELRRAFTNLLNNAFDAMSSGGVLTVSCNRSEGYITVAIQDTGIGMSAETQKKIFSPYFTTKSRGTGLGLSGARRAIRAQGGEISFESTPGVGSTFSVRLPAAKERRKRDKQVA
jgi:signal transduction histidine kinase